MHVFVCSYYNTYIVLLDQTSCKLWLSKLKEAAILLCLYLDLAILISGRISKISFITSELKRGDGKL